MAFASLTDEQLADVARFEETLRLGLIQFLRRKPRSQQRDAMISSLMAPGFATGAARSELAQAA